MDRVSSVDERYRFRDVLMGKVPSAEMRLPPNYGEVVEFVAKSWWRRTLIKLISGGGIEFFPNG